MLKHASHTYTFFTKQQEQGQSEGVGTWFLLICKAWQMDICKLSIKISGTSDRSHPTRWSYVILKLNDLHISSQLILCLALLTVSTLHLQAGLLLKPTPHFLSHYWWGSTLRLTFSLYQSHWHPGGQLQLQVSRPLFLIRTAKRRFGMPLSSRPSFSRSLAWLRCPPPLLSGKMSQGKSKAWGGGQIVLWLHPKHKKNTMLAWVKCHSVHPKINVHDVWCQWSQWETTDQKKPQGGKQTKV